MVEGSKLEPSPLDGYIRAEPNEPVFTLQGGDPFAHDAVRGYIATRRNAAMQIENEKKRADELERCTAAEEVLWAMENYYKGLPNEDDTAFEGSSSIAALIDLHDYRIHCARKLANAFSEMNDMIEGLRRMGFEDTGTLNAIHNEIVGLRLLFNELEPRPGQKIDNAHNW